MKKIAAVGAFATLLFGVGLVSPSSAFADAAGCGVDRNMTTGSSTYNQGSARCILLNGGDKVRVVVKCSNSSTLKYGDWIYVQNVFSRYNCGVNVTAMLVDYQLH